MNARVEELFRKHLSRTISELEREELNTLLTEEKNENLLRKLLGEEWDKFTPAGNLLSSAESRNLLNRILQTPQARQHTQLTWWKRAAAAAILVLAIGATLYLFDHNNANMTDTASQKSNLVTTPAGSKTRLELPDGSVVLLHANSRILYGNEGFGKKNRNVQLTGEAYFDVVKNTNVPFVIRTGHLSITVKGTAFNVKAYPGDKTIETTLVRGLIEVSTTEDPERKILLRPQEKLVIPTIAASEDSDKRSLDSGEPLYQITKLTTSAEAIPEISWTKKQLVFDNETFFTIAPKLESWYHLTIYFSDDHIKRKRFTGVIEQETIKETLQAMQLSYDFNYKISDNVLWISSK